MRKITMLFFSLLLLCKLQAQLVVIFQSPPGGITYKPQLWNMVLTNTSNAPINLHMEITLNTINSSQQVLSGVTKIFTLPAGTSQVNATWLMPIQYNVASNAFGIDANPVGMLPIGEYEACYHFFKHAADNITEIAEQCQEIQIEPLSPPQLVYPYDQTAIEETNPQFNWLPPLPVQLFTNLNYDLLLVKMNTNQSAADAIQQNIPLYHASNLTSSTLLYPLSATALQYDEHYAWKIIAKTNSAAIGSSEIWEFTLKHFGKLESLGPIEQPFIALRKDPETAYGIFVDEIKFSYTNETSDSAWNIKITDLSKSGDKSKPLVLDSTKLKPGQNMVKYKVEDQSYFIDRHQYLLEILNSRNEVWRLRFEMRKTQSNN